MGVEGVWGVPGEVGGWVDCCYFCEEGVSLRVWLVGGKWARVGDGEEGAMEEGGKERWRREGRSDGGKNDGGMGTEKGGKRERVMEWWKAKEKTIEKEGATGNDERRKARMEEGMRGKEGAMSNDEGGKNEGTQVSIGKNERPKV